MKEKEQNLQPLEKKTILIVEDDEVICRVISMSLAKGGYLTISARSVEEAWDILERNKVDLIMTDIMMEGLDGFDLISRIRTESLNFPIIVLTSRSDSDTTLKALKMGAIEVLKKPFHPLILPKTVGDILNKIESEKEQHHYKNLADMLAKKNEILEEKLQRLSKSKAVGIPKEEAEKYNAVCSEVAHNLKSEFMHIGHSLNEIRETAGTFPEIIEECNMIERSLAYSRLLMQRLLNFLEMGSIQREPIELKVLIQKIEELAGPRLPSNIRLQIHIPAHLDKTRISGNYEQLMAIFLEFVNNASRVLHSKGGIIEIKLAEKDNCVFIFIKDNGPGIPGELKNKILKEQVPSKNGGLGIGLFLSGKVIKEFDGDLQVETVDGKGTTFTISFPTLRDQKEL